MSDLLPVTLACFATAVVAMTVTAVVSRRVGRVSVVDVTWGIGLTVIAAVCAVLSASWVSWLLVALVATWGLRLSWHIWRRSRGQGEDPRYAALLDGPSAGSGQAARFRVALRKVFLVQGVALWFVAWPLQAAAVGSLRWPVLVWVGVVTWLLGFLFEAVGDAQLAAYRRDPDRPPVLDRGLWAWTRHPNYFGDACVWWGIWLAGGAAFGWWAALLSLPAPVMMTYYLVHATGARPLESTMMERPGYRAYAARTSMFVPRPPRRRSL